MSEALDYEGVFGNNSFEQGLMPSVMIDKITLENNSVTPDQPDNPHIVDYRIRRDVDGDIEYRQGAQKQSATGCFTTVDIVVKDVVDNDAMSLWFYDAELLKYMRVKIVQSTNAKLTNRLISGDLTAIKEGKRTAFYDEKVISLKKYTNGIKDFYSSPSSGRGLVADIPYQAKFFIPVETPQHLSYFAFCFFDIQEMISDYNLNLYGYNKRQGIVSKRITSEIVIQGGEVVSKAYVFYTPDGKIWTGGVHQHKGVWMAGEKHTKAPHPILSREEVINYKVQDFRDIDEPLQQDINLKPVETILSRIRKATSAEQVKSKENVSYFSEAYISSDLIGDKRKCSFTFSFDYEEFFKQNSEYGKLFSTLLGEEEQSEILEQSEIIMIKVYRNRVDDLLSFNDINSPVRGTPFKESAYINSTPSPTLVVESKDVRGILKNVKTEIGSIREIDLENSLGTRTFSVTDESVDDQTDGLYRYSIEVRVKDSSVDYLNKNLIQFSKDKTQFELYSSICSTPDYYDDRNKTFTTGLKRHYQIMNKDPAQYPWVKGPARLCSLIKIFTGAKSSKVRALYRKLYGLVSPRTGTPEGVLAVLSLMDKMESILITLLGDNRNVSIDYSEKSGKSASFEKFVLTDTHTFTHTYDTELGHKYGINFLGVPNRNEYAGPFTITVEDYLSRLSRENQKYFVNNSPRLAPLGPPTFPPMGSTGGDLTVSIDELGDVRTYGATYLTPAVAYAGEGESLNLLSNSDISSNLARYINFGISSLAFMSGVQKTTDANFLGLQGVSVKAKKDDADRRGLSKSDRSLGDDNKFVQQDISFDEMVGTDAPSVAQKVMAAFFGVDDAVDNQVSIDCFNLANDECSVLGKYTTDTDINTEMIKEIPNQIKSIFFSNDSSVSRNNWIEQTYDVARSYETAMMFIWNYQIIAKIEYLSGYDRTPTESVQVSSPVWKPLTYEVLESLRSGNKTILCKVVNYYDKTYGIGQSKFTNMPMYNKYFHIAANDSVAGRVSKRRPRRRSRARKAYNLLLENGVSVDKLKDAPRGALKTVMNQLRAKNSSGDVADANKNLPDQGRVTSFIDLLIDEAEGVCTASLPPFEYEQETYYVPQQAEEPVQDDSYTTATEPSDSPEENNNKDYTMAAQETKDKIFNDIVDSIEAQPNEEPRQSEGADNSEPKNLSTQQQKDYVSQYIDLVYDIPGEKSANSAPTSPSGNTGGSGGQDDTREPTGTTERSARTPNMARSMPQRSTGGVTRSSSGGSYGGGGGGGGY